MGTIVSRRRKDGSLGYTAQIRIHRQGKCKRAITSGNSAIGKAIGSTAAGTARAANHVVKKGFEMARKKSLATNTVRVG